jgi:SAM-dependent methyltransferase
MSDAVSAPDQHAEPPSSHRRPDLPAAEAPVLDVGCGEDPLFRADLRVDARPLPWASQADVTEGLPFADGELGGIYCRAVLEHIAPDDLPAVFREFARVLCEGGWLFVRVPHAKTIGADCSPSHRSAWTVGTVRLVAGGDAEYPACWAVDRAEIVVEWPNAVRESRRLRTRGGGQLEELAKLPFATARVEGLLRKEGSA